LETNFDFFCGNDNIITECGGEILYTNKERILERKLPILIGEYSLSVWDIDLANLFDLNIINLISDNPHPLYEELLALINSNDFKINQYSKLIIINSLLIHKDYSNKGITEEFIETMFREYYNDKNAIIAYVIPFQNNPMDKNDYIKEKTVLIKENNDNKTYTANEYYGLSRFLDKKDHETNKLKLFSLATKCGFIRLDDKSNLFLLKQDKVLKRIFEKFNNFKLKTNALDF
jgi:hypothetical protein